MKINDWLVLYYPFNWNAFDFSWNWYNWNISWATPTKNMFEEDNSAYNFTNNEDYIQANWANLTSLFTQWWDFTVALMIKQLSSWINRNIWSWLWGWSNRFWLSVDWNQLWFMRYNWSTYVGKTVDFLQDVNYWTTIICVCKWWVLTLYRNGIDVWTSWNNYLLNPSWDLFCLGYANDTTNGSWAINADMEEIRIYNTALSPSDAKILNDYYTRKIAIAWKQKNYQIKTYWIDWTYKSTISPKYIMSKIDFTNQINGGQGELVVKLALPMDNTTFTKGDVLQLTCYDENHINWRIIYTWTINRLKRQLNYNGEYIELSCVGLLSLLNRIYYNNWTTYTVTVNDDPSNIMKSVIDYFNTKYLAKWFSYGWVYNYGNNVNMAFDYTKCNDIIYQLQKITSTWFYFIDANWVLKYKNSLWTLVNHIVKIENQVDNLYIEEEIESWVNKVFVDYWTTIYGPINNAPSQSTYWIIENTATSNNVEDEASAIIFWNEYLLDNKDWKKQTRVTLNSKYDIEAIQPGDTITILNTNYPIDTMLITKVQYRQETVVLSLERYETFAEVVLSNK